MRDKTIWSLGLSLLFFFSVKAQMPVESSTEQGNTTVINEESGNIYEIPDDIFKNLETNPSSLHKPSDKSAGKTSNATNNSKTGNKKNNNTSEKNDLKPGVNKMQGYRIQVFSDGSNPTTLQVRARARGNAIVAKFPKYRGQVYSFSQSPNWYTRIGNFKTSEEASKALAELKKAFPHFAAEMRVVKSSITIIKK